MRLQFTQCRGQRLLDRDFGESAVVGDLNQFVGRSIFLKLGDQSHRGGIASGKKNVPLEEVEKNSFEKLKTITGPAGTAWLENAYGLHLGTLPKGRDRLIAAIGYSILPQPFTTSPRKYQPGLDPFAYDPYINRLWVQDEDRLSGRAS